MIFYHNFFAISEYIIATFIIDSNERKKIIKVCYCLNA